MIVIYYMGNSTNIFKLDLRDSPELADFIRAESVKRDISYKSVITAALVLAQHSAKTCETAAKILNPNTKKNESRTNNSSS